MKVAIISDDKLDYNRNIPFSPSQKYPEYPFSDINSSHNSCYDSIRNLFVSLNLDLCNYNTPNWNPLGYIIGPNDTVVIKPNLVASFDTQADPWSEALITHSSIIRAVLDYVYIAMKGSGTIIIGEAPLQSTNFQKVLQTTGINSILDFYNQNGFVNLKIVDFRTELSTKNKIGLLTKHKLEGDPLGYTIIDLDKDSELDTIISNYKEFRVTNYDKSRMKKHHNEKHNEYLIPNSILTADTIINLPKLKTHRKAGMTCSLKNLIGINGSKDWLPHHRYGSVEEGGDEYLHKSKRKKILTKLNEMIDIQQNTLKFLMLKAIYYLIYNFKYIIPFRDSYFEGSWYGNNTIPRTITDINKIVCYADKHGSMTDQIQRKIFIVVDAIIAGEEEGPLKPAPKYCKTLVAGENSVAVDLVCSQIMGFDWTKIPTFRYAMDSKRYKLFEEKPNNIQILANNCNRFEDLIKKINFHFVPSNGWKKHIEYAK